MPSEKLGRLRIITPRADLLVQLKAELPYFKRWVHVVAGRARNYSVLHAIFLHDSSG
jgi:hypothetical protein